MFLCLVLHNYIKHLINYFSWGVNVCFVVLCTPDQNENFQDISLFLRDEFSGKRSKRKMDGHVKRLFFYTGYEEYL